MALNQRVMVKALNSSNIFEQPAGQDMIIVYRPKTDSSGGLIVDNFGSVSFERAGGVKSGSTGAITGASMKANRNQFIEYKDLPPALGIDLIHVYPVQLEQYQGIGWFIGDSLKSI